MGRFWIGVVLLILLLALGLWVMHVMDDSQQEIAGMLETASQQSLQNGVAAGSPLARTAKQKWENRWRKVASVADHAPMDEIDSLFARLEVYAACGDRVEFAACCKRVAKLIEAVGEAHSLNWWNLL